MFKQLLAAAGAAMALSLAGASLAKAPPPAPPVEAYGQLPALAEVSLSPDGQRIAFIGSVGGKRVLGVRSLAGENLGAIDLGDTKVRDVRWGDNDHVLITSSTTTSIAHLRGGAYAPKGEYWTAQSYDVRTRRFITLMDYGAAENASTRTRSGDTMTNIVLAPPSVRMIGGKPIVFVGGLDRKYGPQLFRVNIETGRADAVGEGGGLGVLDPEGNVVATSDYYGSERQWRLLVRSGAGWNPIYTDTNAAIDTPSQLGVGRRSGTVLVRIPGRDVEGLYEFDITTGARQRLDFEGGGDANPIYGHTGALIGFAIAKDDMIDYLFVDQGAGRVWATLKASFPGSRITIQSWTPDYKKVIVSLEGPRDAGTIMLVDLGAGKATKLGSVYPGIPGEALGEKRLIAYTAADGMRIPAYLTLPPGRDPRGLPLVVLPHGGPQSRDYPGFDWFAQPFAARGYAVLQPQFRGSDGFGVAHLEAGYDEWGKKMQTDLSDGVRYLAAQGVIDPRRVCIFGWSYGGYAAMAGPTIDPGVYRCAVAGAGVSDLRRMLLWEKDTNGGVRDSLVIRYWKRFMGASRINDGSLDAVSPALQAARADAPILLIHGRDDTVVPYEQSVIFERALKAAGKPVEFVTLDGEDHNLSREATRRQAMSAAVAFVMKHNPPD